MPQCENSEMTKKLLSQQEEDFHEYRTRVERLEEEIVERDDHDYNMVQVGDLLIPTPPFF